MTLASEYYQNLLQQTTFVPDQSQQHALSNLDRLSADLQRKKQATKRVLSWLRSRPEPLQGLYLWGGVGRGKSFLMDLFYDLLPIESKRRVHMHAFMQGIHADLQQRQGQKNPLLHFAKALAAEIDLICIDEFVVTDIADAMIMAELLQALYQQNLVLVMTSNVPPERLYEDGLQRHRFVPAVECLNRHNQILMLEGGQDYRERESRLQPVFYLPLGQESKLDDWLLNQAQTAPEVSKDSVLINGRAIQTQAQGQRWVWFDFEHLCDSPRHQSDYLLIAQRFDTVILSGIPRLSAGQDDVVRRFILLIDVLYDQRIRFLCTAEEEPKQLYQGQSLAFEFQRTASRLIEMRSPQYSPRLQR